MESKKKSTTASNEGSNLGTEIYKSLIDNSSSAIFLSKPTGEIIEVNIAAEKMFGYCKTEFLKIGKQGILDQTDFNLTILLAQRREKVKAKGEITGIKKNNERFPIEFTSSIFNDHSGEELICTIMQDITGRKIVEQEMLMMLNNTEECFMLLDKDLLILNFNKQLKNLYKKYFHSSVEKGITILDFVKPERLADAEEIYKSALRGEVVFKILDAKDEEGLSHYFKIKFAPFKNEAHEITGFFITIREITEETKSTIENEKRDKKLKQAEVNYRELFEKGIDGIFIHEQESGRMIDANQKACEIFGLSREEILKLDLSVFAESSSGVTQENLTHKLIKANNGLPQLFEGLTRHSNGTLNWVEVSLQSAIIAGTKRILAYFRLINDRKNAELQSELQRKDKEALINTTEDLIWSVNKELKLLAANNAFNALIKKVTNKHLEEGDDILMTEFGEAIITKWKNYYSRALNGDKYNVKDQTYNPSTNTIVHSLISFNPIYINKNEIVGVACYQKNITELAEKQIAIEATNAELDHIMESSLDMICTISDKNIILRISAASKIILGYEPEELIGKCFFDFVYKEDLVKTQKRAKEIISGKDSTNFYNRYIRKDGSLVHLEWTSKSNKKDKIRYSVARDVTAKIAAENNLKSSEQKYRSLVQDGSDMITILDAEANYIYTSPYTTAVLGYTHDDFFNKNAFDFIHADDLEQVRYVFSLLKKDKKVVVPAFRFRHKEGNWCWIETTLTNLIDEASIKGIVANSKDVTERKNEEKIIKQSNERFELVTKATYDAIWEWDMVNNTLYRAEGFERSFGFNLNELNSAGTEWEKFIHADDREDANKSFEEAIKNNKEYWSHDYRLIKPNGEQAYVEDCAYILRNEKGEPQRIIGALRDITDRKYNHDLEILEKEILEKNAKGEKSIEELIGEFIIGIQKLHPGMICSLQKIENNLLYNLSSPDLPKDFLAAINGIEITNMEGCCGTAAFLKQNVIVSDIANDIRWSKFKNLAENAGLKACWSFPILNSKNIVIAILDIYYKTIKTPTAQEENTVNRVNNILQTILENYHRKTVLLQSNERYLNITKVTLHAIWDWDIAANKVFWGETYMELFGILPDHHLTDTAKVIARLHPEEKENLLANVNATLIGTDVNWSYQHRYLRKDKNYAYVLNKAFIVRNENGDAIRVVGAMQDITQQKKEEQYLKLMSSVVISTNDAVIITEAETLTERGLQIIFANEAFTKMTGYTEVELVGKTPHIFQGPKTDLNELSRLEYSLKGWETSEFTLVNYKKNGEEFWNNFTVKPVADEKGYYTHFIWVEKDVTERKNDELLKELLRKIRIIFNEPVSIKISLNMFLKEVTTFAGFKVAASWLLSEDKKKINRATYYVADSKLQDILSQTTKEITHTKEEGLVGLAWETLSIQTWDFGMNMKNGFDEDSLIVAGIKKLYAIPFLNNAEIIGVLVFGLDRPETCIQKFENLFNTIKIYLGAEIKRKQLEHQLNQIFNFAPDILAMGGPDGYFKKINPAASKLLEYSLDELMAVPFITFVHPEDANKTIEAFKDLISFKITLYFECRFITKSGKVKWLAWTSIVSEDEEDVLYTVGKDITEKKNLEVVLNKTNNLARIGSWELDLETSTLFWSEMTKQIHETSSDFKPSLETAMNSYKEGKNRDQMIRRVEEAIEKGIAWDVELLIITEKGHERWIRSIGETEFKNGICTKVFGSLQDINERKRSEENIRKSEERRELIMNAALDAIICIDKNGAITFWNSQAEFIFGWTEAEMMGKILSHVIIPIQYRKLHDRGMKNYFKTGKGNALNVLLQLSAIKKSGEEFPIELTILPIAQNEDEFFCAFIRDITERKFSETRMLNLNHSLQKQTHQLEAINKELEQFAYVASHDLQEPLRMITSFLSQIEQKYENVLDEKGKKYIYYAVDGARRMRQIILDLLEYSTIGRIDDLKENIDLNIIVDEIKILYNSKIEEQQATFITAELPVILSYKSPIRQVFQNIIGNSLKYCKQGRPCLIKIFAKDKVTHWQFSIQDNGLGINKEYFEKIFVIFQRLHTKEIYPGTGLGLAVTKKIIENLNGKIWLESVENKETIFHFTLPKI